MLNKDYIFGMLFFLAGSAGLFVSLALFLFLQDWRSGIAVFAPSSIALGYSVFRG
jgi:hypothetical protein